MIQGPSPTSVCVNNNFPRHYQSLHRLPGGVVAAVAMMSNPTTTTTTTTHPTQPTTTLVHHSHYHRYDKEVYNSFSFPMKLFAMLEDAPRLGFEHIVSWQPGGQSFKVLQPEKFATEISQTYFNQTKYKSFQRQLNIYGFNRIHHGPNKGGYAHHLFQKMEPDLCKLILRQTDNNNNNNTSTTTTTTRQGQTIPSSTSTSSASPTTTTTTSPSSGTNNNNNKDVTSYNNKNTVNNTPEPNQDETLTTTTTTTTHHELDESVIFGFFQAVGSLPSKPPMMMTREVSCSSSPTPSPCHEENHPPTNNVHSDTSNTSTVVLGGNCNIINNIMMEGDKEHSFPWKLHTLLEEAEKEQFENVVSWVSNGTAFKVHNIDQFVTKIMPNYFDQTKYESFRRQLNLYSFTRVTRGSSKGTISHPHFFRSDRSMCRFIARKGKEGLSSSTTTTTTTTTTASKSTTSTKGMQV